MISITREIRKKYKANEPIFTSEILELFKDKSPSYIFKQLKKIE